MEKEIRRGNLLFNSKTERYEIVVQTLTCGYPIQAFVNDKLIEGTIEAKFIDGKMEYVLLDENNRSYKLNNGMEVLFYD